MAAELVIGGLVSASLNQVFEQLVTMASGMVDLFTGKDEAILRLMEELKVKMSTADLLLIEAEKKLITDHKVRQWIDDLKNNIYNADDLVYKIQTEALRNELESSILTSYYSTTFNNEIKPELEEILGKLNLYLDVNQHRLEHLKGMRLPEREWAPLLDDDEVYGRNANKEEILELLLQDDMASSSSSGGGGGTFSVIPIVGMGGVGKTTLAQFVYKDERVKQRFGTRVWITVGDGPLDLWNVMRSIVEKVTSRKCEIKELHDLQEKVKRTLSKKKFVFVLDDLWDEDCTKWNVLRSCFKSGLQGSKIIVTTRSTKVASIVKTESIYKLKPLSDEDSWALFANHALLAVDSNDYLLLKEVGEKIVAKCKGLPLAIKSIGDLLRGTRCKEEWESILNNDIWELYERKQVNILPSLWLSYLYLPSKLKQCFAHCSLFPKDFAFSKKDMVLLWMAEGFLHSENGKRVEEVGEEYFQDLISKSFFQPSSSDGEETFLMHDLIHDLAMFISGEFCLMMNDSNKFSPKVRHLRCEEASMVKSFEELFKVKCFLRTLLFLGGSKIGEELLSKLHESFPRLRVLSIDCIYAEQIQTYPDSIGNLKYLRYLKLRCRIKEIPNTICSTLYNLETLLLEECVNLTILPTDIGNLINLRHLSVSRSLKEMPLQLGKLQNLQTLNRFVVGRNRDCGGIELLKEFQDLHGSLFIKGLEIVNFGRLEQLSDAAAPLLKSKKSLSDLSLLWNHNREAEVDELHKQIDIFGALEPHPNLKELSIWHYKGYSFPNWMGDPRCLSNLVSLKFICCCCSLLPSLGQLPCLKYLQISFCGVEKIDSEFYGSSSSVAIPTKPLFFTSLETLIIENLEKLKEWSFTEGGAFPRLKKLMIETCPYLRCLPKELPTSLSDLHITYCPLITPRVERETGEDWPIIAHIPNIIVNGKNI